MKNYNISILNDTNTFDTTLLNLFFTFISDVDLRFQWNVYIVSYNKIENGSQIEVKEKRI